MATPTNVRRTVSFPGIPPVVNKTACLPSFQDAKRAEICMQINQLFTDFQAVCGDLTGHYRDLNARVEGILSRLDAFGDDCEEDLSLTVMKVVASRIGAEIYRGHNCRRALAYLEIAKQNESRVRKSTTASDDSYPWWENLELHWQCFFKFQPRYSE